MRASSSESSHTHTHMEKSKREKCIDNLIYAKKQIKHLEKYQKSLSKLGKDLHQMIDNLKKISQTFKAMVIRQG